MKYNYTFTALAAFVSLAFAQQKEVAAYGQCGGVNFSGSTSCFSGYHCEAYNDFYSQCVAGAVSSSDSLTAPVTTAVQSATSSSAPPATAYSSEAVVSTSQVTIVQASSMVNTTRQTKVATSTPVTTTASVLSTSTTTATFSSNTTNTTASGSNPSTSGVHFVIDGETGYFAGTNAYWTGFLTNNSDVDLVMQHLSESGLKILRVWGFNDVTSTPSSGTIYFQSFAGTEPTINTGADGLQRLDYVVKSAEAHGIKLIINFVNNWTDYGGMAAYFSYAGISDNTQWYNSTKAQTQYQKYIKAVVSRYSNSSAVFAWELANEPRCTGCDLSIMTTWVTNTAKYIKSLDPDHMVTTGEEGFGLTPSGSSSYPYTTDAAGSNFTVNCAIPEIDFCVYHLYPESWSVTPTQEWGNDWITDHAAACAAVGKPCLLKEYGASDNCTIESDWQATALKTTGTGADLFWQYGDVLSTGQTAQDGNTVFYGDDLYTCLVTNHVKAIDAA